MISNPINFQNLVLKHRDAAAHEGGEDGTAAGTANGASSMDGGASGEASGDTEADEEPCRITFGSLDGKDGAIPAAVSTNGGASGGASGEASGDTKVDEGPCQIAVGSFDGQDGTIPAAVSTNDGASGEASGDTKADEAGSVDGCLLGEARDNAEGDDDGTALLSLVLVLLFIGVLFTVLKKVVFTAGDAAVAIATTFSSNATSAVVTGAIKPVTSTISRYSSIGYTWLVRQTVS